MSSRLTLLCGILGPSPGAFLKGKRVFFRKTGFQNVWRRFIIKIGLYTYQAPKNREILILCHIHFNYS